MSNLGIAPRVSVVMCTYRGTKYLREQLHSILDQSLQPVELIVCDDASDDDTVKMLYQFRESAPFPVHIFVNERTLGSTQNFDRVLQRATADFIALCDQDDVWLPDKLAVLTSYLVEHPDAGGVFSDAYLIDDSGNLIRERTGHPHTLWELHRFSKRKQFKFMGSGAIDLLLKHDIVTGATLMVRADVQRLIHPIPVSWVHDAWIAWMLVLSSHLSVIDRPLVFYRIHAQQQLGVGGQSRCERFERLRNSERDRYARVAHQFEALHRYVFSAYPQRTSLLKILSRKISLLQQRSTLPRERLFRTWRIGLNVRAYWKYARGWRSIYKDMRLD